MHALVIAINGDLDLENTPLDSQEGDIECYPTQVEDQHITLTRDRPPLPYSIPLHRLHDLFPRSRKETPGECHQRWSWPRTFC